MVRTNIIESLGTNYVSLLVKVVQASDLLKTSARLSRLSSGGNLDPKTIFGTPFLFPNIAKGFILVLKIKTMNPCAQNKNYLQFHAWRRMLDMKDSIEPHIVWKVDA